MVIYDFFPSFFSLKATQTIFVMTKVYIFAIAQIFPLLFLSKKIEKILSQKKKRTSKKINYHLRNRGRRKLRIKRYEKNQLK